MNDITNNAPGIIITTGIIIALFLLLKASTKLLWKVLNLVGISIFVSALLGGIEATAVWSWAVFALLFGFAGWVFFRDKPTLDRVIGVALWTTAAVLVVAVVQSINGQGFFVDLWDIIGDAGARLWNLLYSGFSGATNT